eukprot:6737807-Lingulodinium_polyedra.AAC.1
MGKALGMDARAIGEHLLVSEAGDWAALSAFAHTALHTAISARWRTVPERRAVGGRMAAQDGRQA